MRFVLGGCLFATMIAAAFGCSSSSLAEGQEEKIGHGSSAIINGSADTAVHDSVVLIGIRKEGQIAGACTGTLVAPNLVLTARHCVSDTDEGASCKADGTPYSGGAIGGNFAPGDLFIYTGVTAIEGLEDTSSAAARGADIIVESANVLCDKDVAFILLDRTVNAPVAPIRLKEGARDGESLTAVGWGLTEEGSQPSHRLQRGGVRVEAIGPLILDEETEIGLSKSEFLVGEAFCSGDSGGPSFASTGAVVGVVSRGGNGQGEQGGNRAAGCIGQNTIGFYTHLAKKPALVAQAFQASGYAVRDEGTPPGKTIGAKCTDNVDCSSNACVDSKCIARCDAAGKCSGDNETCTTRNNIKVCVPGAKPASSSSSGGEGGDDPANAADPSGASKTTTTTTTGCSAAPSPSGSGSGSSGAAFAILGLALSALARKKRSAT